MQLYFDTCTVFLETVILYVMQMTCTRLLNISKYIKYWGLRASIILEHDDCVVVGIVGDNVIYDKKKWWNQ